MFYDNNVTISPSSKRAPYSLLVIPKHKTIFMARRRKGNLSHAIVQSYFAVYLVGSEVGGGWQRSCLIIAG